MKPDPHEGSPDRAGRIGLRLTEPLVVDDHIYASRARVLSASQFSRRPKERRSKDDPDELALSEKLSRCLIFLGTGPPEQGLFAPFFQRRMSLRVLAMILYVFCPLVLELSAEQSGCVLESLLR